MTVDRPGFAALERAPFACPPFGWKEDSAVGAYADRIPSLTGPALDVGAPSVASPLGSPRRPEGEFAQELLHGQIHELRVSEVASVAAPSIAISCRQLARSEQSR